MNARTWLISSVLFTCLGRPSSNSQIGSVASRTSSAITPTGALAHRKHATGGSREHVGLTPVATAVSSDRQFPVFGIRGVPVAAIDLLLAREIICRHAGEARGEYVTVTGAHGIVESARDKRIQEAHCQAFLVVPDGMPLVWLGKLLGLRSMGRVRGTDLMECIFAIEEYRQLRHFFYGANPAVIAKLCDSLRKRFGEFNFVGAYSPPMKGLGFVEQDIVLAHIRDLEPHLIWVGLSTPKQELWMNMHMPKIGAGIALGVGAAFNLASGIIVDAPQWIQRMGLEWLFRLAKEPRRLYKRYIFIVPRFLYFFFDVLVRSTYQSSGTTNV
jgi:N-acetylglucosaminyldiphosphoundecaprenol N-acetyl-beta-D-mannosaminyltransferase